jgi:hypothetical protein
MFAVPWTRVTVEPAGGGGGGGGGGVTVLPGGVGGVVVVGVVGEGVVGGVGVFVVLMVVVEGGKGPIRGILPIDFSIPTIVPLVKRISASNPHFHNFGFLM